MPGKNKFLAIVLPLLLLVAGAGIMMLLIKNRPAPQKQAVMDNGALVRVLTAARVSQPVQIHSTGTVQPLEQIAVIPQVNGRVTTLSPQCVAGGFLAKGEVLFSIEDTDYRLAVEQARATLAKAQADLATAQGSAEVARTEWQRFGGDPETANPLVLHVPQLNNAHANLTAAKAALAQAELNLSRTEVRVPFNCLVQAESLDPGQYVRNGTAVATIVGTDAAEIVVPLPLAELAWCSVPRNEDSSTGSPATVHTSVGDHQYQWSGRVVRSLGEVDPKGRMTRLAIRVEDPYRLGSPAKQNGLDLAMGMFVEVDIHGHTATDVVVLPRKALRNQNTVWLMDETHKLKVSQVHVLRFTAEEALVDKGLTAGDQVVLTALNGAADGMVLRPVSEGEQP